MAMRNFSLSDPVTRDSLWRLFNEAAGYFTGSIDVTDHISSPPATPLVERQIRFSPSGHGHDGSSGTAITGDSLDKRNFDLNQCLVLWEDYFVEPNRVYGLISGIGTIDVDTADAGLYYGVAELHWDLDAAAPVDSELDLSVLGGYDSTYFSGGSGWAFLHAWASPAISPDDAGVFADASSLLNFSIVTGTPVQIKATSVSALTGVLFHYFVIVEYKI